MSDTPRTDSKCGPSSLLVDVAFARQLETELAQVTEREKRSMATMQRKLNATKGREIILRDALSHISRINSPDVDDQSEVVKRLKRAVNVAKNALSVEPPDVVAVEDVKPLLDALRQISREAFTPMSKRLQTDAGIAGQALTAFTAKYPAP